MFNGNFYPYEATYDHEVMKIERVITLWFDYAASFKYLAKEFTLIIIIH